MNTIVHYVFCTYKRKKVLIGEIAKELRGVFKEISREKGLRILGQSILVDHVHLLMKKNELDRNEYVMKMIKGISAYRIFKRYPSNRLEFRKLWGRGYRAVEVKNSRQLKLVMAYIKGQKIDGIDKRAKPNWKPRRLVAGFQECS